MEDHRFRPVSLRTLILSLFVGACAAHPALATGITIHVTTGGTDAGGDGSAANPYLTPQRALRDVAPNRGDTICLGAGAYPASLSLGADNAGLTLTTCAGETRATLTYATASSPVVQLYRANNVTIGNLRLTGPNGFDPNVETATIAARESNNFQLVDSEVVGGYYGVKIDAYDGDATTPALNSTGAAIRRCFIHDSDFDAVHTFNADAMTIEDSEMANTGHADSNAQGIDVVGSLTLAVRRCYIHDVVSTGIQIKGGSAYVTVERNRIVNSGGSGILLGQDTDPFFMRNGTLYEAGSSIARNNLIVNVDYAGLGAYSANGVRFYNNTVVNAARLGQAGIWVVVNSAGTHPRDVKLWNNIFTIQTPNRTELYQDLDTPVDADYNLFFDPTGSYRFCLDGSGAETCYPTLTAWHQAAGADAHSLAADPALDGANLYEPMAGSPAIDHGATLPDVTSDYSGTSRPQGAAYDIGAQEAVQSCQTASAGTAQWLNASFLSQSSAFTVEVDATPLTAGEDTLIALSNGPQTNWTSLACIVRFSSANVIDVRNGGAYQADAAIPYAPNTIYHIRMAVNLSTHRYSAFVTPQGGAEVLVARDYAFRAEQQSVAALNNWVTEAEIGSVRTCNLVLRPALNFYTVAPCRVADTRATGATFTGGAPSIFTVAGVCGIPANAAAVAFNVTAVSPTAPVDLQVYPGDQPAPGTNVVSTDPVKSTRAAAAVIALAGNGAGTVGALATFHAAGQVDLVLDATGYFAP